VDGAGEEEDDVGMSKRSLGSEQAGMDREDDDTIRESVLYVL